MISRDQGTKEAINTNKRKANYIGSTSVGESGSEGDLEPKNDKGKFHESVCVDESVSTKTAHPFMNEFVKSVLSVEKMNLRERVTPQNVPGSSVIDHDAIYESLRFTI